MQACAGLGEPGRLNGFCAIPGAGPGWCTPAGRFVDGTGESFYGRCVESGALPPGSTCRTGWIDRSEWACEMGTCVGSGPGGICAQFCSWEETYATIVYGTLDATDLQLPCPSGSTGCITTSKLDPADGGRRSADYSYCENIDPNDLVACSLVTGQLLTPENTPPPAGTGAPGSPLVCADLFPGRRCALSFGEGSLVGACDDQPSPALLLGDFCTDAAECPDGATCAAPDHFGADSLAPICLPYCDTAWHDGTGASCADLDPAGALDPTSTCTSLSARANPTDPYPTRLGLCALP